MTQTHKFPLQGLDHNTDQDEMEKHIDYIKDLPEAIQPLGPDSESDEDIQVKRSKTSLFSEEEQQQQQQPPAQHHRKLPAESRRKPQRKRKRDSEPATIKSKEFVRSESSKSSN